MASRAGISGLALGEIALGVILAWSGITNASIAATIKSLTQGRKPAEGPIVAPPLSSSPGTVPAFQSPQNAGAAPGPGSAELGTSATANQALGRILAARYGWATGQDWQALNYGWGTLESGWRNTAAYGPWPAAYGIAQANPGTKYPVAGWPADQGGSSDPATQINWGLAYIKAEYGSPSQVPGWLGQGGYVGY